MCKQSELSEEMARQLANVEIHAVEDQVEDNLDVSVDLIDDHLYLGNLSCARDQKTLESLHITHILTIDLVPLPRVILDRTGLIFKYVKLADVPKEDLISHLPDTNSFIKQAINDGGTVLVHCYFGVSRSAAVVIAFVMSKYGLCYDDALALVRSKRRCVGPNVGFAAQLRLYGHMGCSIDRDDPRFKQFRLKMAGQKLKQVKILPQLFADLVKPDPGLVRERPDPIVYRCKSQSNIIPHIPKQARLELARKGARPPPSALAGLAGLACAGGGRALVEKLSRLASLAAGEGASGGEAAAQEGAGQRDGEPGEAVDGYTEQCLVDASVAARADAAGACRLVWFVEPMAWMRAVALEPRGKLACPKCQSKIGSFNWTMGCKCPCGQKVAPAFYLVPSKVEWSNIVQNVQVTV